MADPSTVECLQLGDHVCWTFHEDDQRLDATVRLVRDGVTARHKVLCFTQALAPMLLGEVLEQHDAEVASALACDQVLIASAQETYLATGRFDPDSALAAWRDEIDKMRAEGYTGLRVIADMGWAAAEAPGVDRLAWYEAQTNRIFADCDSMVVCLYDRRLFPRDQMRSLASAHPATARPDDSAGWTPQLRILRTADPVGLRLIGEADLATRDALCAVLTGLPEDAGSSEPLTLELTELSFADGAAIQAVVRAAMTAPAGLRIVGESAHIRTLLRLVGGAHLPDVTATGDVA